MRKLLLFTSLIVLIYKPAHSQKFELVWSDEFNQAEFDITTWNPWEGTAYNNEHQYYTPRIENIYVSDGYLYLVGLRENYGGREWTSGRINTQNNFEFQYGRVEIRAKLPAGKGLWPAFWMLGSNIEDPNIGWPYSGEIDIMEYRGNLTSQTSGTVHFSAVEPTFPRDPNNDRRLIGKEYDLPSGSFSEDFHLFQFEWTDSLMTWYIDDVEFFRLTREEILEKTSYYPFDQPFYLILNLAIGGNFLRDQQPDASTPNQNPLIVDYIRVFQDVNKKPTVELNYGESLNIKATDRIKLEANVTDEDGTIEKVEFYINDKIIYTDSIAPYTFDWSPKIDGCYEFKVKAYDDYNGVGTADSITFIAGSGCKKSAFFGSPISFPGTLEFEHYDYGGLHTSYYDSTPDSNLGNGKGNDFRTTEAVDIIIDPNNEDNYLITELDTNEWIAYELSVDQTGLYDIELRVVGGSQNGRLNFTLNGEDWIYFTRLISQDGQYYTTKRLTGIHLEKGTYELRMEVEMDGNGLNLDYLKAIYTQTTTNEQLENQMPSSIHLRQNFPNPFNPSTNIIFELPSLKNVQLNIYNSLGQIIKNLYSGRLQGGIHTFLFNATGLSSGVYYYQLIVENLVFTQKMILLK